MHVHRFGDHAIKTTWLYDRIKTCSPNDVWMLKRCHLDGILVTKVQSQSKSRSQQHCTCSISVTYTEILEDEMMVQKQRLTSTCFACTVGDTTSPQRSTMATVATTRQTRWIASFAPSPQTLSLSIYKVLHFHSKLNYISAYYFSPNQYDSSSLSN